MATTTTTGIPAVRQVELLSDISKTFEGLENALSAFSEEQFNLRPFEGSWTPGQVAEHLIKSVSLLPDKHTQATKRAYDEKAGPIVAAFLDFSTKMKSPDFVLPGERPQDQQEVLELFRRKRAKLENTVRTCDLSLTCMDFEMPVVGLLTRYEWIRFFVAHIQRHTWQLGNILTAMGGKKNA